MRLRITVGNNIGPGDASRLGHFDISNADLFATALGVAARLCRAYETFYVGGVQSGVGVD